MSFMAQSLYFGVVISLLTYWFGMWLKKRLGWAVLNPILTSVAMVIVFLKALKVDYGVYNEGAKYISYLLTPATVCLAIPLYKQLELLKKNWMAVAAAILAGVAASAASIFALCLLFRMEHVYYVTLLPKSITTAIGMGVSEEAGGIVTIPWYALLSQAFWEILWGRPCLSFSGLRIPLQRALHLEPLPMQ